MATRLSGVTDSRREVKLAYRKDSLDRQIAQVKSLLGFRPGVEAGCRLLHDVSFCGQPAAWAGPQRSRCASPCLEAAAMPHRQGSPAALL
jgi:hypothetical protein